MIYLASPYSHRDPAVREERFQLVCKGAAALMHEGKQVFSPIAHSHPICAVGGLPTDWDYWAAFSETMLRASTSLLVLRLDGWDVSLGIAEEIAIAAEMRMPISHRYPTA